MEFEIIGSIRDAGTIAPGPSVRARGRLRRLYGRGRWRKRKGTAKVRLPDGVVRDAEVHW
ncbi:MAG TPA: hypothetical protein VFD92_17485 [Candidatus Binatia bacterium]|nr:hypothetical protein [Candidatus Binatia bacterium]